jgi:hypothetical protein
MKIDKNAMQTRGRENNRSIGRKIVAAIAHRRYGIPITDIGRYFAIGSSSVSRMLDQGETYARDKGFSLKH